MADGILSDRELLELAAKAANQERSAAGDLWSNARGALWNPLADDGDALRLAASCGLIVDFWHERVIISERYAQGHRDWLYSADDENESINRTIVRVAARIAKESAQ